MSMADAVDHERRRARRWGWWTLFTWAGSGAVLDGLHAFRIAAYLDHPLRRELLTWAHVHGVGLALVLLAYAAVGNVERAGHAGRLLRVASLAMPLGFALSLLGHSEADPGPAILLVPIGALCLLTGLFGIARAVDQP
jgi:hypothetical protein